ncbi:MAG: hypothetical protein WCJ09_05070 [Planctomycetota bacterium]
MAAASNKPGAVHYALIVFVMISVVLGILTYNFHQNYSTEAAKAFEKTNEVANISKKFAAEIDKVEVLKKLIGITHELVYDPADPKNANTVKAAGLADIAKSGGKEAGVNYTETLKKLREAITALEADRDSKATLVATLQAELKEQSDRLNKKVVTADAAQTKAETERRDVFATQDERLKSKQDEVDRLKQENNTVTSELQQEKEAREKDNKQKNEQIGRLEKHIDFLVNQIDELRKVSFEVGDGLIQRVDNASKTVWINLGEADFLKTRMTFSVYSKDHQGVGRGAEDVKGKIEVTRILGPHIAEARITDDDLFRPMLVNDVLYTPLWSPGLVEKIAFVGLIDLDNDGKSDWEEMKQLLSISGADVDLYIDESGIRHPEDAKVSVQTKFLVRGYIPEPGQVVNEDDKVKLGEVRKQLNELTKEARETGVRIIKLNDFLAHIGFESKRRTFRPGQERPFNLKAGAASGTVGESIGDRSSNGNVSGAYGSTKRKSAPQQTSDGHTSKLFTPQGK